MLLKYYNFLDIFLKKLIIKLPKYLNINKNVINLEYS